jgi:hypothetical protein
MLASALLSESRLARRAKEKVRILDDIPIARRTFNCSAGFCIIKTASQDLSTTGLEGCLPVSGSKKNYLRLVLVFN